MDQQLLKPSLSQTQTRGPRRSLVAPKRMAGRFRHANAVPAFPRPFSAGPTLIALLITLMELPLSLIGADDTTGTPHVVRLEVEGPIGPATTDYLTRGFKEAHKEGANLIILRMDTPGGLVASTRDIIKAIMASPVPVATYVHPSGARAASAGTYILYASHVAAMTPTTNVGAATPVQMGGGGPLPSAPDPSQPDPSKEKPPAEKDSPPASKPETPSPSSPPSGQDAMSQKAINDAAALLRGLAQERGRNAEWAEKAVREGASLTAQEALEKNVIDFLAGDIPELLEKADGMQVEVGEEGKQVTLETKGLTVHQKSPDWRTQFLALITNPTIAYLLLMIGIYGLIFEGSNPGAFVPGVIGSICILLALYALQVLPVNYAGLLLIVLGVALMVAEAFAPSFGILGIGGVIALVIGSVILMDTDVPGFGISPYVIGAIAATSALLFLLVVILAARAWRRPVVTGQSRLIGSHAVALGDFDQEGRVRVLGESWLARTESPVTEGESVVVTGIDGLTLYVKPNKSSNEVKS